MPSNFVAQVDIPQHLNFVNMGIGVTMSSKPQNTPMCSPTTQDKHKYVNFIHLCS